MPSFPLFAFCVEVQLLIKFSPLERPKFYTALVFSLGSLSRGKAWLLEQSGLQCLLPYSQQHRIQGNLSALLSGHLRDLQSPLASVYFFSWSEQGVTPAFFKELSELLSIVELYGVWTGALMVRNTSAHQEASASLWVCPSLSIENSSFAVFYTSLVFCTSCSTAYSFRLCKMLWRCLFQREFCLKSRRTLQAVQYVLPPLV